MSTVQLLNCRTSSSPEELASPGSPSEDSFSAILTQTLPSFLSNNVPLPSSPFLNKFSIHHQDAEVSIADATDCLRTVSGKIDWFHRKHCFCPHLISTEDATQIATLHRKILIEEIPFLELQSRLQNGMVVDIPRELEGRIQAVCGLFDELKHRIDDLVTSIAPKLSQQTLQSINWICTQKIQPNPQPNISHKTLFFVF